MKKNTGKPTESLFEGVWQKLGKRAYCYRIADAAEVRGRTGVIGLTRASPSDYIISTEDETFYAEVKSTHQTVSFPFSMLKKGQIAAAPQVVSAGGKYVVFVRNLNTGLWYEIPWQVIQAVKDLGRSSITWKDLENLKWKHQPS